MIITNLKSSYENVSVYAQTGLFSEMVPLAIFEAFTLILAIMETFEFLYIDLNNETLKHFFCCSSLMQGNHTFDVPNGYSLKITSGNSGS